MTFGGKKRAPVDGEFNKGINEVDELCVYLTLQIVALMFKATYRRISYGYIYDGSNTLYYVSP